MIVPTTYAAPPGALLRRAALATFSTHLETSRLMEALWLLQTDFRRDDMATLIAYVNAVAERHGLLDRRKRLYAEYYGHLKGDERNLPPDPWPQMLESPPVGYGPVPVRAPADAGPVPAPPPVASVAAPADEAAVDAPTRVFAVLMSALLDAAERRARAERGELLEIFRKRLGREKVSLQTLQHLRPWLETPRPESLRRSLDRAELGLLVHVFYIAVCDTAGPVQADLILTDAVETALAAPEARVFSPRLLL